MNFRAVGSRIAVTIADLCLPICDEEAVEILMRVGFCLTEVDIVEEARRLVGTSLYRRGARLREAPGVVDCSSLIKYLYGLEGIWLPRRSIQQREYGQSIDFEKRLPGDVIFCSGHIDYYTNDPSDGVGHVGLITGCESVVHAANRKVGVVESQLSVFSRPDIFRGIRRFADDQTLVFESPPEREIEISDDLRWIVLQNL